MTAGPLTIFLVAGEESGDQLGAGLMQGLTERLAGNVRFVGVGGERMARLGLRSLFPMSDIAHNGLTAVLSHLPQILARIRRTVAAAAAAEPDVAVVIDSPDFNLRVARRLRALSPHIPIVDYVSPTVWAWRSGRARHMARYVDRLLAILPFEPEVHRALGGPPCTYVGHPLIEKLDVLRPVAGERPALRDGRPPTLLVLPGSRRSEVARLLAPFGETVALLAARHGAIEIVLPAVPHLLDTIRAGVAGWPVQPAVVVGEAEKFAAFRRAHAALAASGTVTLELALAGVPMVVAYRLDPLIKLVKGLVTAKSIVLANLVIGQNVIPEFIDRRCAPPLLLAALEPLLTESPERAAQVAAFGRLDSLMRLDGTTPTEKAADIVLELIAARRGQAAQRRLEIGT